MFEKIIKEIDERIKRNEVDLKECVERESDFVNSTTKAEIELFYTFKKELRYIQDRLIMYNIGVNHDKKVEATNEKEPIDDLSYKYKPTAPEILKMIDERITKMLLSSTEQEMSEKKYSHAELLLGKISMLQTVKCNILEQTPGTEAYESKKQLHDSLKSMFDEMMPKKKTPDVKVRDVDNP